MKPTIFLIVLSFSLLALVACSPAAPAAVSAPEVTAPEVQAPEVVVPEVQAPEVVVPEVDTAPASAGPAETIVDEQGAVVVSVTPLTLDENAATLDFEVAMNTHSVDLSMDLAQLARLTTDTGREVTALTWSAPLGGHHASGTLSFPAEGDGARLLDGASLLTLTLQDVDVPVRSFTWTLN